MTTLVFLLTQAIQKVLILYVRSVSTPLRKVQLDSYFCVGHMGLATFLNVKYESKAILKNLKILALFP